MPSIACKCGNRLNFGEIPNPVEWLLVSDTHFDMLPDLIETEALYQKFLHMLKCGTCARIWIFWQGFEFDPVCYELADR